MKYTIDKKKEYTLLVIHEEKMDSTIAPELKAELITQHAQGIVHIILDLSEVLYIDSSGLSALLIGNRIFHEEEGLFILIGITPHVKKLITISQLDSILQITTTLEEAVQKVKRGTKEGK